MHFNSQIFILLDTIEIFWNYFTREWITEQFELSVMNLWVMYTQPRLS